MSTYCATVELIRSVEIEFDAENDSEAIETAQKYTDSLNSDDFENGGSAIDWGLIDTCTNRTVVPLGDVL